MGIKFITHSSNMVIALDTRPLNTGIRSGIPEFTRLLFEYLFSNAPQHTYILFGNALHIHSDCVELFNRWSAYPNVRMCMTRFPTKLFSFFLKYFKYPKLDTFIASRCGITPDVVVACNFDFFAFSKDCKPLLVVHDITYDLYPSFNSWRKKMKYKALNPQKTMKLFSHFIVNSSQTLRDILQFYHVAPSQCTTIPFGVDEAAFSEKKEFPDLDTKKKFPVLDLPFILFLDCQEPRKNISLLLDAYRILNQDSTYSHIKLCVSGAESYKSTFIKKAKSYTISPDSLFWIGELNEEERYWFMKKARVLVYPSFYEGFGFPPLQAAICGTTVISALHSSIGEVMQDTCITCDPYNSSSLVYALKEVLGNSEYAEKLSQKALEQAAQFPFSKTGAQILKCIERVVATNN